MERHIPNFIPQCRICTRTRLAFHRMCLTCLMTDQQLDFYAPIELEEVLDEFQRNINVLDHRVKQVVERLLPRFKDIQARVSLGMTRVFVIFISETFSNCQRRVRGTTSPVSLSNPQWSSRGGAAPRAMSVQDNFLRPAAAVGRDNISSFSGGQLSEPSLAPGLRFFQFKVPYHPPASQTQRQTALLSAQSRDNSPRDSAEDDTVRQAAVCLSPPSIGSLNSQIAELLNGSNEVAIQGKASLSFCTSDIQDPEDSQEGMEMEMETSCLIDSDASMSPVDEFTP